MKRILTVQGLLISTLLFGVGAGCLYSQNQDSTQSLRIEAIEAGELADLIGINGGLLQGIERGMVLSVFRDGRTIGELLVTRSTNSCSVALITQISPNESLKLGDRATLKVRSL